MKHDAKTDTSHSLRNHRGQHDAQPQPSASKSRCSWCLSDHPSDGTWCWTRFDKMGVDVRQVGSHQHKVIDSDRKSFYSLIWPCGKTCVYLFQFCKLYQIMSIQINLFDKFCGFIITSYNSCLENSGNIGKHYKVLPKVRYKTVVYCPIGIHKSELVMRVIR